MLSCQTTRSVLQLVFHVDHWTGCGATPHNTPRSALKCHLKKVFVSSQLKRKQRGSP